MVIAWQTTLTLMIAVAIGGPLGIAAGRLAWDSFARSLGAVPVTEVPVLALIHRPFRVPSGRLCPGPRSVPNS